MAAAATCVALAATFAGTASAEDEPAVQEGNLRVVGDFQYTKLSSEELFQFRPTSAKVSTQEANIESGGITAIYAVPLGDQLGARGYIGFTGSKFYADTFDDLISLGMTLGGDAFWRNPKRGEIGLGAFWALSGSETANIEELDYSEETRVANTLGGRAYVKYFRDALFGFGPPADFDASFTFADVDFAATVDDTNDNKERVYATRAGVKIYPADQFSLRVGGSWQRTNYGRGGSIEDRLFDADAELLIPTNPGVTLGAGFFFGERQQAPLAFQNFGREIWGVRLGATVNFVGAESLVDLHRRHF